MARGPFENSPQNQMMERYRRDQQFARMEEREEAKRAWDNRPPPTMNQLRGNSPSISELRGAPPSMGPMPDAGVAPPPPPPAFTPQQSQPLDFSAGNPFAEHAMNMGFSDFQPQQNVVSMPAQETISKAGPNMASQKAQASALRGGGQNG